MKAKTSQFIKKSLIPIVLILFIGIVIGRWTSGTSDSSQPEVIASEDTVWTCSMHPQIRQDHPGTCPLCGMDLTPADNENQDDDLPMGALRMSPTAMQLAQIETQIAGSNSGVDREIRLSGKVQLDPAQTISQNAHVSGRIEALYFHAPGEYISEGTKIATVYSPELLSAQKELLLTYANRENAPAMYEAVRDKMKLWKINEADIDAIIQSGEIIEVFPIYANHSGYLVAKNVEKGSYIEAGESWFTLSKLTSVWGVFDVYEKDAGFVKKGMDITYSLRSIPGVSYDAKIDFVAPVLNPETRTLNARIKIDNSSLDFKPEMLIEGIVKSHVAGATGKIVVPKSAVMWTGTRSLVYVKHTTDSHVGFEMRPVTLGPQVNGGYIIESGLQAGEAYVVEGTFSVDAAAQLANKPSMMNFDPKPEMPKVTLNASEKEVILPLFDAYFKVKDALVEDDFEEAKQYYGALLEQWNHISWNQLPGEVADYLKSFENQDFLKGSKVTKLESIERLRDYYFYDLSEAWIQIYRAYGPFDTTFYVQHCPMAKKDQGADWLSLENQVRNPYYGASMLKCGEVVE